MNYTPKSKEWFIDRIGKRIYRDMQGKKDCCGTCGTVRNEGLIVHDEMHADYLWMTDHGFSTEGIFSNYRDEK